MPIEVEAKGQIFEFPDGTSQDVMKQALDSHFNVERESQPAPTEEGLGSRLLREAVGVPVGLGKGLGSFGRGVAQFGLEAAEALGADVGGARQYVTDVERQERETFEQQFGGTIAPQISQVLGEAAPAIAAPIGGFATVPARIAAGAGGGAVSTALQPTAEDLPVEQALERRGELATTGALIGGGITAAIPGVKKAAQFVSNKVFKTNPAAAKDFIDAEVQSSLASISDSGSVKILDRFVSKFPGGIGKIAANTEKTFDDLNKAVQKIGSNKAVSKEEAGFILRQGGENYEQRFKTVADKLYNRLDKYLAKEKSIPITRTAQTLQAELAGLPAQLTGRLQRNEGVKLLADIVEDSADGSIPYETLKRYRTELGRAAGDSYKLPATDAAIIKKAYTAVSDDIRSAARASGRPAVNAFEKANTFYKQGSDRLDELKRVTERDSELVFDTLLQRSKKGGTRINSVMRSLKPDEQDVVRATVINNLGRPTPGQAGVDEVFSPRRFLTNWNTLAPEAKNALFGAKGKVQRDSLDRIARVSDRLTQIDRFGNPSGTAQQLGMGALFLGGMAGGAPGAAVGGVISANVASRLLTNKSFSKWLAKASEGKGIVTPKLIDENFRMLKDIAEKNPDLADDIFKYMSGVNTLLFTREEK